MARACLKKKTSCAVHPQADIMKAFALNLLTAIALSVAGVVSSVSFTIYTDAACSARAADPVAGMTNPTLTLVNTCFKSFTVGDTVCYNKITACDPANTSSISYSNSVCTVCPRGPCSARTIPTGTCIPSVGIPGVGSYKIGCVVSAASPSQAVAAVVFVAVIVSALL
jgi:energy-converting hydrogenase Eha subunit C